MSHIGSSTSLGHYISHVKVIDDWYCCNDSLVTAAEFSDFSDSKECYLLFFVCWLLEHNIRRVGHELVGHWVYT